MADHALAAVTNPSAALTDFTLIVDLSTLPQSWWDAVTSSDGTKGRVYKGDGSTRLAADWIDFDDTAETGLLRVKWAGSLATSGTQQLWIEPPVSGNDSVAADGTYGSDNAYDTYWVGYWPDAGVTDRTSNSNDGTAQGGVSAGGTTGVLGNATDFDGTNDYISIPDDDTLSLSTASGNSWFLAFEAPSDPTAATRAAFAKYADTSPFDGEWYLSLGGTSAVAGGANGGAYIQLLNDTAIKRVRTNTNTALTGSAWNTVGFVWDGALSGTGHMDAFLNGSSVAVSETEDGFDAVVNRSAVVTIGAGLVGDTFANYIDGKMSHVSFHSTQRSSAWMGHEDDQVSSNATFWGTWSWVTAGGTTLTVNASDGIVMGATIEGALKIGVEATDGMTAADGDRLLDLTLSVLASDQLIGSDSATGSYTLSASAADTVTLADLAAAGMTLTIAAADGIRFTDTVTEGGLIEIAIVDGIAFDDAVAATTTVLGNVVDGVVLSAQVAGGYTLQMSVTDGLVLSDLVSAALRLLATMVDGLTLSDIVVESSQLAVGRVVVTISARTASVTISSRVPSASIATR